MVASTLVDLVKVQVNSMGAGPLSLGQAMTGFRGVEALQDGALYSYSIIQPGEYEVGQGQYVISGAVLNRSPQWSSNGNAPISVQAGAICAFTALSTDINTGDTAAAVLRSDLLDDGGANIIGTPAGTVQEVLDALSAALAAVYTNLVANTGAALVGWIQAGAGAVTRLVRDKLRDSVCVADYGTVGDGIVNDAPAIQACITANPGKRIRILKGTYKCSSALTILGNGTMLDMDRQAVLAPDFVSGDFITVGNNSAEIENVTIQGGNILPSVTKTSGFAIAAYLVTKMRIHNVNFDTIKDYVARGNVKRNFSAIKLDGWDDIRITGGQLVGAGTGIQCNGRMNPGFPSQQSYGAELQVDGLFRMLAFSKGIHLGGACGGVHLGRGDLSLCDTGVHIDMAITPAYNREIWLDEGFQIDVSKNYGLNVESDAVGLLACRGAWINSTSMAAGQSVAGSCNVRFAVSTGLSYGLPVVADFIGCDIGNAYGSGMELSQGQVLIANNRIRGNGAGVPGGHGIHLANLGAVAIIRDNVFANNGNATKGYDVERQSTHTGASSGNCHSGAGQGAYSAIQDAFFQIIDNYGYTSAYTPKANPAVEWGIDYVFGDMRLSIAGGGTLDLGTGSGLVIIHDDNTGAMGMFMCFAGTVVKVAGDASMVVSGTPTTSQTGIFYNPGTVKYRIVNGFAAGHNYVVATIRTRQTS